MDKKDRGLNIISRRSYNYILIFFLSCSILKWAIGQEEPFNLISPRYQSLQFPKQEFVWLDNELQVDSCLAPVDSLWITQSGDNFDLLITTDGPHGSGRYWTVTLAIKNKNEEIPSRGICLETSTIGWRTLQYFKKLPLPWVDDQNDNGQPEFILWDSFPLNDEPTMAEFGLIGWVYELNSSGNLELNIELTRILASEIAAAYRLPLKNNNARFQQGREEIAQLLESFISE